MQIQGTHTFKAPRQVVWAALMDPTLLAMALPGGEALEQIGENEYKATMNVRVGPVQGKFEGKIELTNIEKPDSYHMAVSGQGAPGFLNGGGTVRLEETGAETLMHYTGDVQVGGKIAGVGQRLIDSTAKSLIRQGLAALDSQIAVRAAAAAPVAPAMVEPAPVAVETPVTAATTPAPSVSPAPAAAAPAPAPRAAVAPPAAPSAAKIATEVAKDVARDIASDIVPLKYQEKLLWFGLGAVAMLVLELLARAIF